jgi:hypothetical protein
MGENQETNARNERSLRRVVIVEKWWHRKVKKAAKQSEVLQKEIGSRGKDERKKE